MTFLQIFIASLIFNIQIVCFRVSFFQNTEAAIQGVLSKRCSEIYRRTPMQKCDFNKVAKLLY